MSPELRKTITEGYRRRQEALQPLLQQMDRARNESLGPVLREMDRARRKIDALHGALRSS